MPSHLTQKPGHPGFRIFVLGAGFSRPAGLPLANEIFPEIIKRTERRHGLASKLQRDIETYLEYRLKCDGVRLEKEEIDFEDFISFLDVEHFLGLRGSDTWSAEGNETQVLVKYLIGQIIHERTPAAAQLPDQYIEFAKRLTTNDLVITFNYDVILERALDHIKKPYRLFQDRYTQVGWHSSSVDNSKNEVIILKMHGSLDWFSDQQYKSMLKGITEQGSDYKPRHSVFNDPNKFEAVPIVDGPRRADDPLLHLHRIKRVNDFYSEDSSWWSATPFILSPSHVKFIYAKQIADFWFGLGRGGAWNLGVSIVGFSLPKHDDYIRIGLFKLVTNYQESWWDEKLLDHFKDYVKLVDFRHSEDEQEKFWARYQFSDRSKTRAHFAGFDLAAVDFLFSPLREQ